MKMKKCFALILAAVLLFSLAACGSSDKDAQPTEAKEVVLSAGGVSITLPEGFKAATDFGEESNVVAGCSGDNGYIGIYVTCETLATLEKDESYTAEQYVKDVHDSLEMTGLSEIGTRNGLPYFTYTETVNSSGKEAVLKYLNIGYRSGENCYLAQFFCYEQEYDYFRDRFFKWAGTVKFSL